VTDRDGQLSSPEHGPAGAARPATLPATLIVLGAAVWAGGVASPSLYRRALHAASLWHAGGVARIVATGGVGRHAPAEAEVAAAVMRAQGVPPEAILCETRSRSTFENIAFARLLLSDDTARIILVSDRYHLLRARLVARLIGLRVTSDGPPRYGATAVWRRAFLILREALALPLAVPMTLWRLRGLDRGLTRR